MRWVGGKERDGPKKVLEALVSASGGRVLDVRSCALGVETPSNKIGVPFANEHEIQVTPVIAHDSDEHVLLVVLCNVAASVSLLVREPGEKTHEMHRA